MLRRISAFIRNSYDDEECQYQAWRFMFVLVQLNAFIGLLFALAAIGAI